MTKRSNTVAGAVLALTAGLGLASCGNDDAGDKDDISMPNTVPGMDDSDQKASNDASDDAYEGPYNAKFREWANDHDEATASVTANVKKVIGGNAFTLASTEDDSEDLLVVDTKGTTGLQAGVEVTVTGTVHKAFDLPFVEDEIDVDFENDVDFKGFDRDPYIQAKTVSVTP